MKQDQRTIKQNDSLHSYIEQVAREMSNKGLPLNILLKDSYEIPATKDTFKSVIVHGLIKGMYQKESTTELTRGEIDELYDVINKKLGESCEIHIPFPSSE